MSSSQDASDYVKKLRTVDLRFDICRDIEQVLKIGRDYQNKDDYRGAHYDTVKLLCDTIEYQQEQLKTKTKVSDHAKLREALENCMELGKKIDESLGNDESTVWNCRYERSFANSIVEIAKAALSKPPRQCDIGTTEEQYKRFKKFCFNNMGDGMNEDRCSKCPINKTKSSCRFEWAQMPYESQNGKG